ncbi:nitroreductase [Ignatzschineria ureiclastica]|uniref:Nitroreductase n=1 Tax=Ignatzschineria ureiclastica TaxID=472582 RepID=A0A2U2ACL8_9GAMM|nr:nitroreductase family protein [Ignatzschineria ureiclastica]PWD80398.1 nitroreductase [Ignatzschineria ureiclastica]GGZ99787.1 hypothetical protein GCM10007162_15010 [Ignatzschineria ureiclastica]
MSTLLPLATKRRSIYHIGKNVTQSPAEISDIIREISKQAPSAFNSQSSRVVVLFGDEHNALWDIVENALSKVVPAENFAPTKAKIDSFRAGFGSILYYEDEAVVKGLQEQFPAYAHNFPRWSEHAHGITLYGIWMALAEVNIGATVQHYNELIEADVKARWDIPDSWSMRAQMPFGSIESPAEPKDFMPTDERFIVFGA